MCAVEVESLGGTELNFERALRVLRHELAGPLGAAFGRHQADGYRGRNFRLLEAQKSVERQRRALGEAIPKRHVEPGQCDPRDARLACRIVDGVGRCELEALDEVTQQALDVFVEAGRDPRRRGAFSQAFDARRAFDPQKEVFGARARPAADRQGYPLRERTLLELDAHPRALAWLLGRATGEATRVSLLGPGLAGFILRCNRRHCRCRLGDCICIHPSRCSLLH